MVKIKKKKKKRTYEEDPIFAKKKCPECGSSDLTSICINEFICNKCDSVFVIVNFGGKRK